MKVLKSLFIFLLVSVFILFGINLYVDANRSIDLNGQKIIVGSSNSNCGFLFSHSENFCRFESCLYLDEECSNLVSIGVQNVCRSDGVEIASDGYSSNSNTYKWYVFSKYENDETYTRIDDFNCFYFPYEDSIYKFEFNNCLDTSNKTFFNYICNHYANHLTDNKLTYGVATEDFLFNEYCTLSIKNSNRFVKCTNYEVFLTFVLLQGNAPTFSGFDGEVYTFVSN